MQTRTTKISFKVFLAAILIVLVNALNTVTATAATASEIDRNVTQALITLYQTTPGAKVLADSAVLKRKHYASESTSFFLSCHRCRPSPAHC